MGGVSRGAKEQAKVGNGKYCRFASHAVYANMLGVLCRHSLFRSHLVVSRLVL